VRHSEMACSTSESGQNLTCAHVRAMSGLTPISDIGWHACYVRSVPEADSCSAAKDRYSITSSAVESSDGGIVTPRALAVLRLMMSSNLTGCWTGRSAGFSPLLVQVRAQLPPFP
jgi:hypothetical protein